MCLVSTLRIRQKPWPMSATQASLCQDAGTRESPLEVAVLDKSPLKCQQPADTRRLGNKRLSFGDAIQGGFPLSFHLLPLINRIYGGWLIVKACVCERAFSPNEMKSRCARDSVA